LYGGNAAVLEVGQQPGTDLADRLAGIREIASLIVSKYDRKYIVACAEQERQPTEMLEALAECGLLGIGLAEEYGGSGGGLVEEATLIEVIARAGIVPDFVLVPNFARVPVVRYGTPAQAERFAASTLRTERRPCFAITEPDAGTNSLRMRTSARPTSGGWRIRGQKVFISGAGEADEMLLVARTLADDEENGSGGLSLFVVPMSSPGVSLNKQRIHATAPCSQWEVFLDDVELPADALVGDPGGGIGYLFTALNPERILASAMAIGLGDHVLERGAAYARTRAPFDRPIGAYQSIAHPMARAKVMLESARLTAYEAARRFDAGDDVGLLANSAKYLSSEGAFAAMDITIQAHGGYAFDRDQDLMPLMESIRLLRVAPLNNEMILNYVAERALGLPRSY
jgi:acyl-CoA dehydrogenase